ncbi:Uncharacterised protein [Mycobacteroides abscessus subsp. massiliense]|nr:Uncharacterised protein [Mycobacteroides abscessus subsp. massiliense]
MGPVEFKELAPFDGGVLRHHADHLVTLELRSHRHRNAGIPTGGLQNRGSRLQQSVLFGLLDHAQRGTVLDGSGRIAVFQLGPQPHVRRTVTT